MVDNIIDIEGFEKYGPAVNTNIATFDPGVSNLMNQHNAETLMRYQGFYQEWNSEGGSTGSSMGFITGRAGGSSKALCISDGSGNVTAASKLLKGGNYTRTIFGFALVSNLGNVAGVQFSEILTNGAQLSFWIDNAGRINIGRGNFGNNILYTSPALILANQWHYYEIDFTISQTVGQFKLWLDGNLLTSQTNVNTQASNVTNYWNFFTPICFVARGGFDDIYIRDNTNGTATPYGDCTIDPIQVTSDSSVQFSPTASVLGNFSAIQAAQNNAPGGNIVALVPVIPLVNMTVNSISGIPNGTNAVIKTKGVIYSDNSGQPGSLLSSGTEVVGFQNLTVMTLPLTTPQALTANTKYWIGYISDTNINWYQSDNITFLGQIKSNTYTSGAPAGPLTSMSTGFPTWAFWGNCTAGSNFDTVDRLPSPISLGAALAYNQSSTVGQVDYFNGTAMPIVPDKIFSLKVSVLAQRSASGPRTLNIRAKTGLSGTGDSPSITPASTSMQWYTSRFDTDPGTGFPWGPTGINNVKLGYEVAT